MDQQHRRIATIGMVDRLGQAQIAGRGKDALEDRPVFSPDTMPAWRVQPKPGVKALSPAVPEQPVNASRQNRGPAC